MRKSNCLTSSPLSPNIGKSNAAEEEEEAGSSNHELSLHSKTATKRRIEGKLSCKRWKGQRVAVEITLVDNMAPQGKTPHRTAASIVHCQWLTRRSTAVGIGMHGRWVPEVKR